MYSGCGPQRPQNVKKCQGASDTEDGESVAREGASSTEEGVTKAEESASRAEKGVSDDDEAPLT